MTAEIIKEIVNDLKKNRSLLDVQKADFLMYLTEFLYKNVKLPEELSNEIDDLRSKWD